MTPAMEETLRRPPAGPVFGGIDPHGVRNWRGIPYAKPPLGSLRWKAPRDLKPFSEPFAATRFAPMCWQLGQPQVAVDPALYGKPVGSEDCLYLNIWSPPECSGAEKDAAALPVMVWIHGGSNVGGAGHLYNGSNLARRQQVIVVSINYRLGLFGWFSHPALRSSATADLDRSANFGTLDIIKALEWVRKNIAAFGGDPGNVTVFGESAGGMNIVSLLYAPPAHGLFHKAIVQSGSVRQTPVAVAESLSEDDRSDFSSAETAAKLLLKRDEERSIDLARKRVDSMSESDFVNLVRSASGEELIGTYALDIATRIRAPQIIPDDIVIPNASPWDMIADAKRMQAIPVMIGTNRDEMKFFLGLNPDYARIVPGESITIHDPARFELHARYLSDRWRAQGVNEIARRIAAHNPAVYAYRFDWDDQPRYPQADLRLFFGAAHTMELPFVFDDFETMRLFALHFTEENRVEREQLASRIGEYWSNFAYHGTPGRGRSNQLQEWPAWGDGDKLLLDVDSDGGIRVERDGLTVRSLRERFNADQSFASEADKKEFATQLLNGREAWKTYFDSQPS